MVIDTNDFISFPLLEILEHHFYTDSMITSLIVGSQETGCILFVDKESRRIINLIENGPKIKINFSLACINWNKKINIINKIRVLSSFVCNF
jgi:hypothetical protein